MPLFNLQALEQTVKDVTAFMEMFPDLSEEDLSKIRFECFAALPFSECLDLCEKCNKKILTKGDTIFLISRVAPKHIHQTNSQSK